MKRAIVQKSGPVLLVGGGDGDNADITELLALADAVVAADGGADRLLAMRIEPDAVIGDLDSLSADGRAALPAERVHEITDQDSTDFDKCLRHIAAPLIYGVGFLGHRIDHQLAAMNVLVRHPARRCVLFGREDLVLLAPPELDLDLDPGTRLSLFPVAQTTGDSRGLRWPIGGLRFAPHQRIGTSNMVAERRVALRFDAPGMLLILPRSAKNALIAGLAAAPDWPAS